MIQNYKKAKEERILKPSVFNYWSRPKKFKILLAKNDRNEGVLRLLAWANAKATDWQADSWLSV